MNKTVIILGAGASVESGIPAQESFINEAIKIVLKRKNELENAEFYSSLIQSFRYNYYNTKNIEDLYNAVEVLTDFPFLDLNSITNPQFGIMQTANLRPARYLQEAIQFLIVNLLKSLLKKPDDFGFNAYKKLVDQFNGSIITFNWDNLVEQACRSIGKKFDTYCDANNSKIILIKLHGSIDWNYNLEEKSENIILDDDLTQKTVWERKNNDKKLYLSPILIFPNYTKSKQLDQFGSLMYRLWDNALELLSNAEKIIFIGYSLPITDFDATILLQHSLLKNSNSNLEIVVVDPFLNNELKNRYKYLKEISQKNIRLKFERIKFSEYVNARRFIIN